MHCIHCKKDNDKVLETRILGNGATVRRRRMCLSCGYRFTSYERIENNPLKVVKKDNSRDDFSRKKLKKGILTAVRKRPISLEAIENMLDEIEEEVQISASKRNPQEILSSELGDIVIAHLQNIDTVAYLRFCSVYRNFESVEEFIKEIQYLSSFSKKTL